MDARIVAGLVSFAHRPHLQHLSLLTPIGISPQISRFSVTLTISHNRTAYNVSTETRPPRQGIFGPFLEIMEDPGNDAAE